MADPTIVSKLKNGIASVESGGKYNAVGKETASGDKAYGKYQVMGANIPSWTKEATGTAYTADDFLKNPDLQEKVADSKIGQYYDKYGNAGDVASAWFTGGPQKTGLGKQDVTGTTTSQYVNKVLSSMDSSQPEQEISQVGGSGLSLAARVKAKYPAYQNIPDAELEQKILAKYPQYASLTGKASPVQNTGGFDPTPYTSGAVGSGTSQNSQYTGMLGTDPHDDTYGKIIDNSITRGIRSFGSALTGGGTEQLGDANASVGTRAKGALKTAGSIAGLVAGGAALQSGIGLLSGASALGSPAVESAMAGFNMSMPEFEALSASEKLNALTEATKGATAADKLVLSKAIEEITPDAAKELGLAPSKITGLLKTGLGYAKGAVLTKALGDTVGGLVHRVTGN